ncbi:Endonuclease-reverse transcriptase [Popillia japonica]|uniref:Endonuclease-reverse transcriptase n=1 Tax=Popillia japonica TaxID=7064 RepID=A0AAW1KG01_POPJA
MDGSGAGDLVLGSAYLPFDQEGPPPTTEVRALVAYAGERRRELLLGCDANAHHSVWGSTGINRRGELLTNFLAENGLTTLNRGNKPTFETASRAEVIDITVSTPRLAMWVKQWHVSGEPSLSDHRYVSEHAAFSHVGETVACFG